MFRDIRFLVKFSGSSEAMLWETDWGGASQNPVDCAVCVK